MISPKRALTTDNEGQKAPVLKVGLYLYGAIPEDKPAPVRRSFPTKRMPHHFGIMRGDEALMSKKELVKEIRKEIAESDFAEHPKLPRVLPRGAISL